MIIVNVKSKSWLLWGGKRCIKGNLNYHTDKREDIKTVKHEKLYNTNDSDCFSHLTNKLNDADA